MTRFRPCIDIHSGQVKQIVGGTLTTSDDSTLQTNFVSPLPAPHYAELYKERGLTGAHVILLGPGCQYAAEDALRAWPNGLQVGGGINDTNAREWIEKGAEKVILTSYLFPEGKYSPEKLSSVLSALEPVGGKDRLVIDLSCRRKDEKWFVAMNKWQTLTDMEVNQGMEIKVPSLTSAQTHEGFSRRYSDTIQLLQSQCSEFLVHAADVEGLCRGIDEDLVASLGRWVQIPTTYAGGAYHISDLERVERLSQGKVDLTFGSALDIFGGDKVKFEDCVNWNKQ